MLKRIEEFTFVHMIVFVLINDFFFDCRYVVCSWDYNKHKTSTMRIEQCQKYKAYFKTKIMFEGAGGGKY